MKLLLGLALGLATCQPTPKPSPDAGPAPLPVPAPTPPPPAPAPSTTCESACARLRALGCPESASTAHGAPCEAVCAVADDAMVIDPGCVASAQDVAAMRRCGVRCAGVR